MYFNTFVSPHSFIAASLFSNVIMLFAFFHLRCRILSIVLLCPHISALFGDLRIYLSNIYVYLSQLFLLLCLQAVMNRIHTISVPYAVMKACPLSWVQRVHVQKGIKSQETF